MRDRLRLTAMPFFFGSPKTPLLGFKIGCALKEARCHGKTFRVVS